MSNSINPDQLTDEELSEIEARTDVPALVAEVGQS